MQVLHPVGLVSCSQEAQAACILGPGLERPQADRFMRDMDAALEHHLSPVAKAEAETRVQPNAVRYDFGRQAIAAVARCGGDAHPSA